MMGDPDAQPSPPVLDYSPPKPSECPPILAQLDALLIKLSRWPCLLLLAVFIVVATELTGGRLDEARFNPRDLVAGMLLMVSVWQCVRTQRGSYRPLRRTIALVIAILFIAASTVVCFGASRTGTYLVIRPWAKLIPISGHIGIAPHRTHSVWGLITGTGFRTDLAPIDDYLN